jgi:hypothetical protein
MNQAYQPYNMLTIAAELTARGLFQQVGVMEAEPVLFRQPIDAWIEAFHATNGFSRDRMSQETATEFNRHVHNLIGKHCPAGEVEQRIGARVIFGKPLAGSPV